MARAPRRRVGAVTLRRVGAEPGAAPRVAYAVGRSVGGAVTRNRVRRRLRAAVREHRDALGAGDYLFGAGSEAAEVPFAELSGWVRELLERVGRA